MTNAFTKWLPFVVFIAAIVGSQLAACYIMIHQPWTGLRLQPDSESGFVRIESIAANSPATGLLTPGQTLESLVIDGENFPLAAELFRFPYIGRKHAGHEKYRVALTSLHQGLTTGESIVAVDSQGKPYRLEPAATTPIKAIPWSFWVFVLIFLTIPLTCLAVWQHQPYSRVSVYFMLAGAGYYGFYLLLAINSATELSTGALGYALFNLQWAMLWLFMSALLLLTTSYPVKLGNVLTSILLTAHAFLALNYHFAWLTFGLHEYFVLQYLIPMLGILALGQWQVSKTSGYPLEHAAARLMQLALTALFFIFGLFILPVSLKMTPLISDWFLQLLAVSLFIGTAVAVLRLRLYSMEYIWFHLWLWLLGGSIVILCALILVWPAGIPNTYATGIAMVFGGVLYFPLRRWLQRLLLPLDNQTLHDFLELFSHTMAQASTPGEFDKGLETAFRKRFIPQKILLENISLKSPRLEHEGVSLRIPALQKNYSYQLSGKQNATRLFNATDIDTATSMLEIGRIAFNASENRQRAVLEERKRLLQDMHHTVGQRLQTLRSELEEPQLLHAADSTLQTLDETIRLAMPEAPRKLPEHLGQWEAEARQRTASTGVRLIWLTDSIPGEQELSPRQALELAQFIREAVSNALKHAQPEQLEVSFSYQSDSLQVIISNDGEVKPVESWKYGTGLNSMSARIHALNGTWQIRYLPESQSVSVEADIPLDSGLNHTFV